VDDQDFQFRLPVEKRAPKPFEPPPWEKDAFEELEKRRVDDASELQATNEPQVAVEPQAVEPGPVVPVVPAPAAAGMHVATADAGVEATEPLPEAEMLELMARLAEEEPKPGQAYWLAGAAVGLFLVALGGVLLIWATAAFVGSMRTGVIGKFGGTGLGVFGVFFVSTGVWMLYRTLKQRGVL
jgi:hypothetical protein